MELLGQVALVTGASRGIGRSCALALAQAGAAVVINYRERRAEAEAVAEEVERLGATADVAARPGAMVWQADVADAGACAAMVEAAVERFGRLDILINNAGHSLEKLLVDTELEEWDRLMAVHLRGMYACTRAALLPMLAQRYGRIITVSSIWGVSGAACEVAYSTVKAGQIGFTRALAQETGRMGITVNCVAPGAIATEMTSDLTGPDLAEWLQRTPVGRLGTPDEVAAVVRFLAGPGAGFITGQVWSPNGGVVV